MRFLSLLFASALLALPQAPPPVSFQGGIVYGQRGGADLLLDLARPSSPGKRPLVLCVHGGAWLTGSRSGYAAVLRLIAARGYVTAAMDYGLAPKHRFPAQVEDVRTALAYLAGRAEELGIDPRKVALLGDSAGGHLALLTGMSPWPGPAPVRIRGVVNLYGPSDLSTWKLSTPDGKIEGFTEDQILQAVFGTADRASAVLRDASPLSWIAKGNPPVLSFHGEADPVVSVTQSQQLHERLKAAGVSERLEIIAKGGHGFTGADLPRITGAVFQFLETVMRDVPFERIDAHVHTAPPPEAFLEMLRRQDVRVLNVTVLDPEAQGFNKVEPQTSMAAAISERSRGRISWASTFDPTEFESPAFAEGAAKHLQSTFERGAVAVKIYKSVGMYLKTAQGRYVMPDDPAFAPVLETVARGNRTLLAHLAEPRSCWLPLNPEDPHYGYYSQNPQWHMYQHPERPKWETILAARDRMLKRHPKLRVVGCHLGSMEHDVDLIARRLEKYPNFAVDTAARVPDLMRQPREKVRAFLIRYQDRVLWGTDLVELGWQKPAEAIQRWEAAYERDWRYFATSETIQVGNRQVQGLALPEPVLRKIFRENALRWIPGLAQ